MPQSVPSRSTVQATFAATLFDEWQRAGLHDVVVCPGSRSTPLALACAERTDLRVHVRIDERSAGFFAVGRALESRTPVVVVVTSGTAAAELHACVAEADQAHVPLIVVTADRPPELHGVGAPQTINQYELYGTMVRCFEDRGVPRFEDRDEWRALARALWRGATGEGAFPGPVHLNAPFVEPLIAEPMSLPAYDAAVPTVVAVPITPIDVNGARVLCIAGRSVDPALVAELVSKNWVVVGDVTIEGATAYVDPLLRSDLFAAQARPEVVVRIGAQPASKVLQERLRAWGARVVAFDGAGFVSDPDQLITETYRGWPKPVGAADGDYARLWSQGAHRIDRLLEGLENDTEPLTEPTVARTVVAEGARHNVPLVVGSSMPVRDVEWWGHSRSNRTFSNRGVNGIDGVVSTVFGVGAGSCSIGLVGDVTFLHDVSGLVDGLGSAGGSCVLVVVDNRGGGIFSFLSQASMVAPPRFEQLFGTPHRHNIVDIAESFGHCAHAVSTRRELRRAIEEGLERGGVTVVVAQVGERSHNVELHASWNQMVVELTEANL